MMSNTGPNSVGDTLDALVQAVNYLRHPDADIQRRIHRVAGEMQSIARDTAVSRPKTRPAPTVPKETIEAVGMTERKLVPYEEARKVLGGIGKTTFYELIANGDLERVKIGHRGFILATTLDAFANRIADEKNIATGAT